VKEVLFTSYIASASARQ